MRAELRRYVRLIGSERRLLLRLFWLAPILLAVSLEPFLLRAFVDHVILGSNLDLVPAIAVGLVGMVAADRYCSGALKYLRVKMGQRVLVDLRVRLFARLLRQPPAFFHDRPAGELLSTLWTETGQLDAIHETFAWGLLTVLYLLLLVPVSLLFDAKLGLLLCLPFAALGLLFLFDGPLRSAAGRALVLQARVLGFAKVRLEHVTSVQLFAREAADAHRFARLARAAGLARAGQARIEQLSNRLYETVRGLTYLLIFLVGGVRLVRGDGALTLGSLTAIAAVSNILFDETTWIYHYAGRTQAALAALCRIEALMAAMPVIEERGLVLARARGRLDVEGVSFGHAPEGPLAVSDVSFTVAPGQVVAIVGPTGSGKSTLLQLLAGISQPAAGVIRLDGHDVRGLAPSCFRRQISLAAQDAAILPGSVRDNIAYGNPGAGEEHRAAARAAAADGFIQRLPDGYDTLLGDGGRELSGGQAQRIALARAFLKEAPILLLDEATSRLDSVTEVDIEEQLARQARHRACVVVAHRLATIRNADLILVLDRGRIVQRGTHDELLTDRAGLYRALHEAQQREIAA